MASKGHVIAARDKVHNSIYGRTDCRGLFIEWGETDIIVLRVTPGSYQRIRNMVGNEVDGIPVRIEEGIYSIVTQ